jgi:hypothetical protein
MGGSPFHNAELIVLTTPGLGFRLDAMIRCLCSPASSKIGNTDGISLRQIAAFQPRHCLCWFWIFCWTPVVVVVCSSPGVLVSACLHRGTCFWPILIFVSVKLYCWRTLVSGELVLKFIGAAGELFVGLWLESY